MNLRTRLMTRNDCYAANRKIAPSGIMVHSTATPGVMAAEWFARWNKSYRAGEIGRQVCVHAFVDDREAWQYLPWDHRGWHSGGGANNTHIGIEICEPGGFKYGAGSAMVGYDAGKQEPYFRAAWGNAVELCAMLCGMFNLRWSDVIDHAEGHGMGLATSSGDVGHWFPRHGESMSTFRAAVKGALAAAPPAGQPPRPTLRLGDRGPHVSHMQVRLGIHGFSVGVDGMFGPMSEVGLRRFQEARGLAADGVCGPLTWAALEKDRQAEEDEPMTQEKFNAMFGEAMAAYARDLAAQPPSGWAKANWERACADGVFDGTAPRAPLTREQAATVLLRRK